MATEPQGPPAGPPTAEIILAQGCTSRCAYCFSRLSRGHLTSVPHYAILARIRETVGRGAREIRLSSLDTACWGSELPGEERLPGLLQEVAALPGRFKVRIGMMSPQSLAPIADPYFRALAPERFFRFLHLPVQSGSDLVLDDMRRGYTRQDFVSLVGLARARLPELMLSTDVIVGYPTETEAEFERTLSLIEEVAPELVNVTRFSPRPMTPAHRLRPLPPGILKRRSRALSELRARTARARLERWIGRCTTGLVLEYGPHASSVARLDNYLPVALPSRPPLGSTCTIRVDGARSNYLQGTVTGIVADDREAEAPGPALPMLSLRAA